MRRDQDSRSGGAWLTLVVAAAATAGATLVGRGGGSGDGTSWLTAVSWVVAWVAMARFRWFTVRRRVLWTILLTVAWLLALLVPEAGGVAGLAVAFFFAFWKQGSFALLVGRRRPVAFLAAVALSLLPLLPGHDVSPDRAGQVSLMAHGMVLAFWTSLALTAVLGMRLNFLRLRPKLFVTGVLVGAVPLLLMTIFSLLLLYGSLGGTRANRARDVMQVWSEAFGDGRVPEGMTGPPRQWREEGPGHEVPWAGDYVAAMRRLRSGERVAAADTATVDISLSRGTRITVGGEETEPWLPRVAAAADTTAWVRAGGDVWLVRWRDPGPGLASLDALPVDAGTMDVLATFLRLDVEMRRDRVTSADGAMSDVEPDTSRSLSPIVGRRATVPPADDLLHRPLYFGATLLPAPALRGSEVVEEYVLLTLKTSLADLADEFLSVENAFNIGVVAALGVVAVLLALTGLVAVVLSLRITGGITGAVKALHTGTRRLAAGDLDTRIDVANEDEFGDLADSFNEMIVAVKQGREDALARERLTQEMETARRIQERLLPHEQPALAGWEITGVSIPSLQVGGDYFDFVTPGDGRLGIAIGDVSGKGVPAALLMSNLQASLKGQVMHPAPVAETVTRINDLLAESTDPHMFATFFYGELDATTGAFTCANAGHDPALVVRRDGAVEWVSTGGLLLGMFGGQHYEQQTVQLQPGDVVVLYTDGVTEAGAPLILPGEEPQPVEDGMLLGPERLAEVVVAARRRSAAGIREAVLGAVDDHLAGRPQGDDLTLVVIRRGETDA